MESLDLCNTSGVTQLLSSEFFKALMSQFPHLHNGTIGLPSRVERVIELESPKAINKPVCWGLLLCPFCLQLLTASWGSSGLESNRVTQCGAEPRSSIIGAGWMRSRGKGVTCSHSWRSAVPSSETWRGSGGVYGGEISGFEIFR